MSGFVLYLVASFFILISSFCLKNVLNNEYFTFKAETVKCVFQVSLNIERGENKCGKKLFLLDV